MAERKRIGGLGVSDPAVRQWQSAAAENPATVTRKKRRDRKRTRVHIDIDAEVKRFLETLAGYEHEGTSLSQACEILLLFGLLSVSRGNKEIKNAFDTNRTPSHTPRFNWNVECPEEWLSEIARFFSNGNDGGKVDGKV